MHAVFYDRHSLNQSPSFFSSTGKAGRWLDLEEEMTFSYCPNN